MYMHKKDHIVNCDFNVTIPSAATKKVGSCADISKKRIACACTRSHLGRAIDCVYIFKIGKFVYFFVWLY